MVKKKTAKKAVKRKAGKESPALRAWELKYPDLPNLFADDKLEDCDEIFRQLSTDLGSRWAAGAGLPWPLDYHHAAILRRFAERVHAGEEIEPFILEFLADAFWSVLHGMPLDDAIRLPGRPQPPEWHTRHPMDQRDFEMHLDVCELIAAGHNTTVEDETSAFAVAAKKWNKSPQTVRAAYYAWKKRLEAEGAQFSNSEANE
ncbi:hypothetical protein [Lysobacter sp. Root494]|uniref:hypothetical protein n=1 Tax=Lysobacter sp. Root494 TaxID=1736549 RepID=UPI0006F47212|nr:hypothetical protein [Lysobacter sp. Root494]KQY51196.1 hypothetical protein ASD14_10355 [Lysobacter sp. Root494]